MYGSIELGVMVQARFRVGARRAASQSSEWFKV